MSEQQQQWSSSLPAAMIAVGIACFTFFAIFNGKVGAGAAPLLGIWLLGCFVVQLCVGIIELRTGNLAGGNIFLYFSAFVMLVTGLELIFSYFAGVYHWPITPADTYVDGWAWLVIAIGLTSWTPVFFKAPVSLLIVVVTLDVACFLVAFSKLGSISQTALAGDFLLISGICALYTACGITLNSSLGKNIIPMGSIMK
ncbi:MAG: hypothetical protein FWC60_04680 [Firmicutes bacterium]|nr:hypothetical protein [Bacillota bacterium]